MSDTDSTVTPVEIIQPVARKRWTTQQKMSMVEESMQPGNSVSRVARQHQVSPAQLYKWRKQMLEGGMAAVAANDQVVSMAELAALKKENAELQRILGRKTMEIEVLKAAVELGRKKKLISPAPLSGIENFQ